MKRSPLKRKTALARKALERKSAPLRGNGALGRETASQAGTARRRRTNGFAVTPAQRAKAKEQGCIVHGPDCRGPVDPAHVIPRSLLGEGQGDPLAVVGLCRLLHERYDRRAQPFLNLLPFLGGRPELDFAIERYGYDRTLWRVTNVRPA